MSRSSFNRISLQTLNDMLSRYASAAPEKLRELDTLRYDTIPTKVAERGGTAYLTKDEVEKLVEWKLKHGTFRPKLLSLVQSNTTDTIKKTTTQAFEALADADLDDIPPDSSPLPALKILTQLKGIGPATASLLLSVIQPESIPFFSDELFRWSAWDNKERPGGWKRVIKYNVKEYGMVVARVAELRKRLGEESVRAVDVERVAWVLGKEGVDVDAEEDGEAQDEEEEPEERDKEHGEEEQEEKLADLKSAKDTKNNAISLPAKRGTKRKVQELKPLTKGTRKSSRTKK